MATANNISQSNAITNSSPDTNTLQSHLTDTHANARFADVANRASFCVYDSCISNPNHKKDVC